MTIITGELHWASVQEPNTTFEPQYTIDVVLDADSLQKVKSEGVLTIKKDKDKYNNRHYVKIRRNQFKKNGKEAPKPKVVDGEMMPFNDLIGNGSYGKVQYQVYDWTYRGKSGRSGDLMGVQVLTLVPYHGDSLEFKDEGPTKVKEEEEKEDVKFDDEVPF